jgi:cell wall-associated NlpC family hydrolase
VVVIPLEPEAPSEEPAVAEPTPAATEESPEPEAPAEVAPAPVETEAPTPATPTFAERLGLNQTDPFPTITRKQILDHAEAYLTHTWTLGEKNHSPEPGICLYFRANSCWQSKDSCDLWMRPTYLKNQVGKAVKGVPYVWNGFDSLDQFNQKISQDRPAGDVCTPGKARRANKDSKSVPPMFIRDGQRKVNYTYAAGVDCSGFVSRVWQLKGKRGTATFTGGAGLDPVAKEIKWKDIKPGDILDLPGVHVVLYLGSSKSNGVTYVRYIDATPDNGVDERTKPKSYFDNNRYRPMRRLKIDETAEPT